MKILFILKERFYSKNNSYGLINSSKQVADYLETIGNKCKVITVVDANAIDREIYTFKPELVILEALWVTGEKLKELIEIGRYKHIKWVIRVHSDIGFLAAETMAMKYINDYIELNKNNLYISMNNAEFNSHVSDALEYNFDYLPNVITIKHKPIQNKQIKKHIDVACFGSLRILKNQCYQALCAIEMAERLHKKLKFHITVDVNINDSHTNPVYKNLQEIFKNSDHELVEHKWLENHEFQNLIHHMDIGMQLSYTESFNIVAADFVNANVPIVVSDAIRWMPFIFKTSTIEYEKTINKLLFIYKWRKSWLLIKWMKFNLIKYNDLAKIKWYKFIKKYNYKKY